MNTDVVTLGSDNSMTITHQFWREWLEELAKAIDGCDWNDPRMQGTDLASAVGAVELAIHELTECESYQAAEL